MAKPTIPEKFGEEEILKIIRKNQPLTIHALYKLSPYGSYSGMYDCVQRLEKKELIIVEKIKVDKYVRMIKIKEHQEDE